MCNCPPNVVVGSYENQIVLDVPDTVTLRMNNAEQTIRSQVCVDTCIVEEVQSLWEQGIVTTGCCCGHNIKGMSYIGVTDEFIPAMLALGYEVAHNPLDPNRRDSFKPKAVQNV